MSKLDELIQELCPDGVAYKNLNEVCNISAGGDVPKDTFSKEKTDEYIVPIISNGIGQNSFYGYTNTAKINVPAVTIAARGTIGYAEYRDYPYFPIIRLLSAFPKDSHKLNAKYLYYCLQGKSYSVPQGGIPQLTMPEVKKVKIPVPPLPVQREIVRILDNFAELTAELTAELIARKQQYAYYRDKLLTPRTDYRHGKIIDMLKQPITDGPHTTPELMEDGIPFLSVEAVFDGKIHFEKRRGNITPEFDAECCKKYKPQKHDIFMVKSGSTTGKVGYVDTDERFNIWSPLAAMRVNSENSSRYLFHLLQSKMVQQQVVAKASHGSQPNLSMRALEQFDVAIPPLDIQLRLANVLDNFDAICTDLSSGLPAEIEARQKQYEYYRDKLLTFTPAD